MTTVGYGPLVRRDGPLPAPRFSTLLDVAQIVTDDDEHWINGVQLQAYPPDQAQSFDPCGTGSNALKVAGGAIPLPSFGPAEVYLAETCTARVVGPAPEFSDPEYTGLPDDALRRSYDAVADARARGQDSVYARAVENYWFVNRAVIALGGKEAKAAERVLATGGAVPANPHLTDTNLVQLHGGTAVSPEYGLDLLEKAIAGTGSGGVVHADPGLVSTWNMGGAFSKDSQGRGNVYTINGSPVASGDGYLGAFPDGGSAPAAGTAWAFATGPIKIWREPAITIYPGTYLEALDRTDNTLTYRAERTYVITWDTALQAGVLIDRSLVP